MLLQVRLLLLVAGPAYCLAEDWLTFGHDPQKSAHVAGNSVVRMCGNAIACHRRTSSINFVVCSASVSPAYSGIALSARAKLNTPRCR